MSTKIEQLIDEIEDYIDNCKFKALSNTHIIVNKETIDDYLRELRLKTPEEIKRYQKIINNKEAILNDAREKAAALINEATVHTNELVSEHEIMQQAYAEANRVVAMATQQAQEIVDNATLEANGMRDAMNQYTDELLAHVENIILSAMENGTIRYNELMSGLNHYYEVVKNNRAELNPMAGLEELEEEAASDTPEKQEVL